MGATSKRPELLRELRILLAQTRGRSGRDFLEPLTSGLSALLDGAYVQVGRLSADGTRILAEPCAQGGRLLEAIEYDLRDTPCAHVIGTETRYFDAGVAEAYPQDRYLRENGFVSYLGCPMFSSTGEPSGLLSMLSPKQLAFGDLEIALFEDLALRVGADMERAEAVAAHGRSQALFHEIVDQQAGMVCRFSPQGQLTFANRAYLETFGLSAKDVPSFDFVPKIHPDDLAHAQSALATLSPENTRVVIENRIFTPDGRILWTQWTNIGLFDAAGRLFAYQSAGRDITAAKIAEEKLQQAHDQKDRFLAVLAHELRNPLGALMNALSVLEAHAERGSLDVKALAIARRQAQQQARLLDDLLDLSRITHGKVELRPRPLSLFRLLSELAEARRDAFSSKRQRLEVHLPEQDVVIEGDPVRIEQIFGNLLDNAGKYTPNGGCVRLEAEAVLGQAIVRVSDDGQGISKEMQPRVFEMFEQDPRHGHASGLGIGLTVVREMVSRHGGSVSVESGGLGTGSTFTVHLPTISSSASDPRALLQGERPC